MFGEPFEPYRENELLQDRAQCRVALERYNDSAKATSSNSVEEQGRFFRAIVDPGYRQQLSRPRYAPDQYVPEYIGPKGYCGSNTYVEAPFTCDYGYNIHLGDDILIQPGCYMQDACEIRIGARTVIGPNVKFYGMTMSIDPGKRKGSQGAFVAGAIKIGSDCFIGGDVIIMPYRKIGDGAVVGAGSVVTKVCHWTTSV
jgi:acetyltransferase-like isoleucine patch superfamily enzyme